MYVKKEKESCKMKTWLITGCSSGIGAGIAKAVLKSGDRAVVTARNKDKVREIVEQYPDRAGEVIVKVVNGGDFPEILTLGKAAVTAVKSTLEAKIAELDKWADISAQADYE